MLLNLEHFAAPQPAGSIHLFWDRDAAGSVEAFLQTSAAALNFHFAVLPGSIIRDGDTLRQHLGALYDFPYRQQGGPETWDGVLDWLGDLSWLSGDPVGTDGVRGFILLVRDPAPLFSADGYEFAVLLEVLGSVGDRLGADVPFHVVIGPIDDRRMAVFIDLLKVSERFCPVCRYP